MFYNWTMQRNGTAWPSRGKTAIFNLSVRITEEIDVSNYSVKDDVGSSKLPGFQSFKIKYRT